MNAHATMQEEKGLFHHVHITPRWTGDSNFMSILGETRVLPETIDETHKKVKDG
jgi:diadenosine tetraphosphate (Ap4A) HIT family hydrolase